MTTIANPLGPETVGMKPDTIARMCAIGLGWRVVPGVRDQAAKHPITGWTEIATTDPDTIERWWLHEYVGRYVCVVTGRESGVWNLDIDVRHGGFESLAKLEAEHGPLPETMTIATPSGGEHRIFEYPDALEIGTTTSGVAPGIDTRGWHGQFIAPYNAINDGVYLPMNNLRPVRAPRWLELLAEKKAGQGETWSGDGEPARGVDAWIEGAAAIPPGGSGGRSQERYLFEFLCKLRGQNKAPAVMRRLGWDLASRFANERSHPKGDWMMEDVERKVEHIVSTYPAGDDSGAEEWMTDWVCGTASISVDVGQPAAVDAVRAIVGPVDEETERLSIELAVNDRPADEQGRGEGPPSNKNSDDYGKPIGGAAHSIAQATSSGSDPLQDAIDAVTVSQLRREDEAKAAAEEAAQAVTQLIEALGADAEYVIPDGTYSIDESGVTWHHEIGSGEKRVMVNDVIASRPFIVRRWLSDDRGGNRYELTWLTLDGKPRSMTVPASDTVNRSRLLSVFPEHVVTSKWATECVEYISRLLDENRTWLVERGEQTATALGWPVEGTESFTAGDGRPRPVADTKNTGAWLAGHAQRGTLDGWRAAVEAAGDRPLVQAMVAAALAPPLLRVLGTANFAVDLSGQTSTGKTTALNVAAACWGDPGRIVASWKHTRVAIEHLMSMVRGMPVFLNESQLAEPATVEDVVYSVAEGHSKGRSRQDGSALLDAATYEAVILSTGEQPLTAFTRKGGVVPRVVTLTGTPCTDKAQADRLNAAAREHHGHAGPAFVEHLLATDQAELRVRFDRLRSDLAAGMTTAVAGRRADSVAVLALTNELAAVAGLVPLLAREAWAWLVNGGGALQDDEDDRARAALRAVLSWAAMNGQRFCGHEEAPATTLNGWLGRWEAGNYVSFDPSSLKDKLRELGYDVERTIADWRDRGWLKHAEGKNTWPVRFGKSTPRHIMVTMLDDIVDDAEALGGDGATGYGLSYVRGLAA